MAESAAQAAAPVQLVRLERNFYSLGLVLDFLAGSAVFGDFTLRQVMKVVRFQIDRGWNVCALDGKRVLGYSGWMEIPEAMGQLWLAGLGELRPLPPGAEADAFAVTVVAAETPEILRRVIRHTREQNKGRRAFFRRSYGVERFRRSSVAT